MTERRRIVVTHMSSDLNRGDFAILYATVEGLRASFGDPDITCMSVELPSPIDDADQRVRLSRELGVTLVGTPFPSLAASGEGLMRWVAGALMTESRLWALRVGRMLGRRRASRDPEDPFDAIAAADLIVAKGGSYLYAHRGLRELLFLWRMLLPFRIAHATGTQCVLFGVSLGPFDNRSARWAVRRVLNRCQMIYVREHLSECLARRTLQLTVPIRIIPDVALSIAGPDPSVSSRARIGVTARRIPFAEDDSVEIVRERYESALAEGVRHLRAFYPDHEIVFVAQVDEDCSYYESLKQRRPALRDLPVELGGSTLSSLIATYASLSILVGTRLHSVLLAAVAGTPAIHIAYELQKGLGTMAMLGVPELAVGVEDVTPEWLIKVMDTLLRDLPNSRTEMRKRVESANTDVMAALAELPKLMKSVA